MALSLTRSRVRILSCLEKTTTPVHHLCLQLCYRCCRRCENWGFPASLTFPRARAREQEKEEERLCEIERERERGTQTSKDVLIFFVDFYPLFGGSCMLEVRICCCWFCWCLEAALHGFSVLHRPGGFLRDLHSRRLAEVSASCLTFHCRANFLFFFLVCFFEMFVSIG